MTEVARFRALVIEHLYLQNSWREPWIGLVNQEFPGYEPTGDDFHVFEAKREEAEYRSRETEEMLYSVHDELRAHLWENGYLVSTTEEILLAKLGSGIVFSTLNGTSRFASLGSRISAKEVIEALAGDPTHQAWQLLLNRFFPVPEEK
jgi:hypothetical protein